MEYRLNLILRVSPANPRLVYRSAKYFLKYSIHTQARFPGWDVHDMRVFMASLFMADVVYMIFIVENVDNLFSMVRMGDLDLYLTKPISL